MATITHNTTSAGFLSSRQSRAMPETTFFNENGIVITKSEVRLRTKLGIRTKRIPLSGSASSITHTSEYFGLHREETARLRRRILFRGVLLGLTFGVLAALGYGDAVRDRFYMMYGSVLTERQGQGFAFALAAGVNALVFLGMWLRARVKRPYTMYHVAILSGGDETPVASSADEGRIRTIATALDRAVAHQRQLE